MFSNLRELLDREIINDMAIRTVQQSQEEEESSKEGRQTEGKKEPPFTKVLCPFCHNLVWFIGAIKPGSVGICMSCFAHLYIGVEK